LCLLLPSSGSCAILSYSLSSISLVIL
jgi:hypothetical protein